MPRQAGAKDGEIEITPKMVKAGLEFLWDSGRLDFESESDHVYVEGIIDAVFKAGGFSVRTCSDQTRVYKSVD